MKVSFTKVEQQQERKIFSGLREKLFDHDDSTSLSLILKHSLQ